VKEGKTRRRAVSCAIILGGVLISAAAVTLYTPWLGLFDLREIALSGNRRVSAEEIGRVVDLRRGRPLLAIAPSTISARVASLPWIKDAVVRRIFPHRLRIEVRERSPIAWIGIPEHDGACLIVAEGGVIVPAGCESRDTLVELAGGDVSGTTPGHRLLDERVVDLVERLSDESLSTMNIRRIDVSDPSSVTLDADSGLRVLLGEIDTHTRHLDELAALSRTIDLGKYRLIDLRLEGEARLVTW
jgi:cell division septal protein FtsQ